MNLNKRLTSSSGFTLIEVLIALLIVATALGTATKIMLGAANSGAVRADQTAAQWVGLNQMSTLKLRRQWPVRSESGEEDMMERTWLWEQRAEVTPDDNVIRVTIDVRLEGADDDDLSASVSGFVAKLQ
ncbi:type II secretion system minor pseudopilin GspI [Leucothrix arctica]|uniref:Type II secretion system protein I n=1 Tax=Leucothrix arctica TaxID=1481894 RepID=A0A317CKR0_9GAMM|nr:type II secretion system minor pseudopilin GspI [Leucothrix arctica]PWQ98777.1 type II secretion system protein GspI [Leucothrix arctica]